MKILALDPATLTGYCFGDTKPISHGTWDFKLKSYESTGLKFLRLSKHLEELNYNADGIDLIAYEKPSGQHFTGVRSHANFEGVILKVCEFYGINYKAYTASEIKRFATGKGNAKKAQMIEACTTNYNIKPEDDNHADALHLWHLAKHEFTYEPNQ